MRRSARRSVESLRTSSALRGIRWVSKRQALNRRGKAVVGKHGAKLTARRGQSVAPNRECLEEH
nr:MAG TPA: hypothetical protein [Caudoviricetes sp.]